MMRKLWMKRLSDLEKKFSHSKDPMDALRLSSMRKACEKLNGGEY